MNSELAKIGDSLAASCESIARCFAPGVELILGPYRTGKTTSLIDEVVDYCRQHPFESALVVVPSQRYKALFEKRLQERLQRPGVAGKTAGILGLQVLPFYKACQFVLRKSGIPFALVPDEVRVAIIARLLNELKLAGQLETLDPILGFAGTHASLIELIDELQRAALSPSDVLAKLEKTAQSESRYIELARIYERYWQTLSDRGYVDERGAAFAARQALAQRQGSLNLGFVAADGFDRFNLLQLNILEGLARQASHTRICFDYLAPEQDDTDDYVWKEQSFLELDSTFAAAERRMVEPPQADRQPQDIKKVRLLDRFFECAEIAKVIKQRIADGVKPEQILVVARSLSAYGAAVHAAFGRDNAGITYFLDEAVNLNAFPVVQLIMRLAELSSLRNYKRADVIACMRNANFKLPSLARADLERDVSRLDQLSYDANVVDSRQQWLDLLSTNADKLAPSFAKAFSNLVSEAVPPPNASIREYVIWIEDLIDRYVELSSEQGDDPFYRWEEHRSLSEFRRCLAGLIYEERFTGETNCTAEYFLTRLRALIDRSNFRRVPRSPDSVTICGADLAPNRMFEEVFVLGLIEGEFPKRSRQGGFLSADEVERWLTFGIDLRNPRFHASFETALFSSLVLRAKSKVHLSCPMFGGGGDELVPSYLMTGGQEDESLEAIGPFGGARARPISSRDALSALLWTAPSTDVSELRAMLPLTTLVESLSEPIRVARSRAQLGAVGEFNGDLRQLVAARALSVRQPEQWSASRLNDYGKCPFRYWVSHVLRAEPHVEPETGLNPMVIGDTYHKALELFYRTLLARKLTLATTPQEQAMALFQSAANAALALLQQRPDVRHGEFWQFDRNEIIFRLNRFFLKEWQRAVADQEQFLPTMLEAGFGRLDAQPHPQLSVKLRNGKEIMIRGRIDRVDVAAHTIGSSSPKVRLIDYKSGSAAISRDDALSGRNIQLPLYALAVERAIMPGSKVASAMYLSVSSGEPSGRLSFESSAGDQQDDDSVNLIEVVEQHVRNFVGGIESGDFTVQPNGSAVCGKCNHRAVCRIRELQHTTSEQGGN
jgi:ATP-dependent helicase/nuclease subunit B